MPQIRFEQAAVALPDDEGGRVLLSPTDLTLTEGRVAVIGGNGSGKSTLARLVNGLLTPTSGRVLVDGFDVARDGREVRRKVAFSFSDPAAQLVMPTCLEDVELSLRRTVKDRSQRRAKARAVLEEFGLADRADQSVHTLSGGQRQLLAFAGVLATGPEILVSDEPTTLLDLANTRRVADVLFGLDQQLLLITHDLDLAMRCDRALLVDDGRIAADGTPTDVVAAYLALVG